ncbi:MAG: division/cell wall cluster transcriptional repressor MraZ [Deltaproteobacteria bacterium]|nr:MAG: division/cell wall cluster transcriptional repressor MraZ [Deltaproteobacteria bacterium]TMB40537.1 MAG: division/cell wall cluster transcriptional repressor MraZ [Deltaproteobacteria bacterium]
MFSGVFQHSIDAKGRTSLPARFRELLLAQGADKLFITPDLIDPCLVAFAPSAWQRLAEKVAAKSMFDRDIRLLSRAFIAPAQECPVDKLGRILIPPSLREHVGLVEEITWAGTVERIEIWTPQRWAEVQKAARAQETPQDLARRLSELL